MKILFIFRIQSLSKFRHLKLERFVHKLYYILNVINIFEGILLNRSCFLQQEFDVVTFLILRKYRRRRALFIIYAYYTFHTQQIITQQVLTRLHSCRRQQQSSMEY